MTEDILSQLYDNVKSLRGLEMPLTEFEQKFARIKPTALRGNPLHSTVHISIFGLGFEFPEKYLTDDITAAIEMALRSEEQLNEWRKKTDRQLLASKPDIGMVVRYHKFYSRMAVLSCFNLVEAYFNSLAWEFLQGPNVASSMSNREKKLLEDTTGVSLADKILKYPELICGFPVFKRDEEPFISFMGIVKPYRDSLVHPSPFLAPERFGGYDKLRMLYRRDVGTAVLAAHFTTDLIGQTHRNLTNADEQHPPWLQELVQFLASTTDDNANLKAS